GAIADGDVPEIAGGLRAELDGVVERDQVAPDHPHVLRRASSAQGKARPQAERVVTRFDMASGDARVPAAIEIDAIGVPVQDADALDAHALAAEEADVVVSGIGDGQIADLDPLACLEGDRLWASPASPVAVDPARAQDANAPDPVTAQQREAEIR